MCIRDSNHALLTFHCAQTMGLRLAGYIVNHPTAASNLAIETNPSALASLTEVPCLGVVPFTPLGGSVAEDRQALASLFSRAVDVEAVWRAASKT